MSLQIWLANHETIEKHFDRCDVPCCELCASVLERWQAEVTEDERLRREAEQDAEFNALVDAERNGDEPWDFNPNEEEYPSRA